MSEMEINLNTDLRYFSVNLQHFAVISCAKSFWNKTNSAPLLNYFKEYKTDRSHAYIASLVKKKQQDFNRINFPKCLSNEILYVFKCLGKRIGLWYKFLFKKVKLPADVISDTLIWTDYGTIDECKILENWLETDLISLGNRYYIACYCVSIDYIRLHWQEMLDFCKAKPYLKIGNNELKFIICSVLYFVEPECDWQYLNNLKCSKAAYMFSLAIEEGSLPAAQHYWNLLSWEEKVERLSSTATTCFEIYVKGSSLFKPAYGFSVADGYRIQRFIDLFAFFFLQMSKCQIKLFLYTEKGYIETILKILMLHWPWERFSLVVFDVFKNCELLRKENIWFYYELLVIILQIMHHNKYFGLDIGKTVEREMFFSVWDQLQIFNSLIKGNYEEKFHSYCRKSFDDMYGCLIEPIYRVFDLEILDLIINVECENRFRKTFIEQGEDKYRELIRTGQFDLLEKFMEIVLKSEDERKWFKSKCLVFLAFFLYDNRFDLADGLLDWMATTEEQKKNLKTARSFMGLCAYLIVHDDNIQSAEKILKWTFMNDEEKNEYIHDCDGEEIFHWLDVIWEWGVKSNFIENVSKFLSFAFDDDEEVKRFKAKEIVTPDNLKHFLKKIFEQRPKSGDSIFKAMDELLNFFLSPEKIRRVKYEIADNISDWIVFLTKGGCLDEVDDFLDWILEHEENKRRAIKTLLLSDEGIEFLIFIWKSKQYNCTEKRLTLWINMAENFDEIEKKVNAMELALNLQNTGLNKYFRKILMSLRKGKVPNDRSICSYRKHKK